MVAIGKQLPTNIKERLRKLLIANVNVFAWTYADMPGILRTIMVGGKSFNTEHKLNEYKHIKPIKQKRRGLGSDRNEAACREVKELTKAGILRKIRRNHKAYVDDMVIKSTSKEDMLHDIQETFDRANPSKVKAVTDLELPRTLKEIQSLNGKLAALSRFLSKGAEKSLPFFKALKSCTGKKTIQWRTYAKEAFQKMKELVEILQTVTAKIKGIVLVLYLATLVESISVVLLAERGKDKSPFTL
ncbi:hypothetical protein Tco_1495478 [Tanacetum coccineum]